MVGFNSQQEQRRFFPVEKEEAFVALQTVVKNNFKIKSSDDFTMAVSFSSPPSLFTWGENLTAQVRSDEGGAVIEVTGVGKVGGQIQQSSRTNKLITKLFEEISKTLTEAIK